LLILSNCSNKKKNIEEEETIITALLPAIIDSTCMDLRIYEFRLPVPKSVYDKNNKFIRFDYSNLAKDSIIYKGRLDSLNKDTSTLYVQFNPILKDVDEKYKQELFYHFKIKEEKERPRNETLTIPYQNIKTKKKFKLQISSKMPKINKADGVFSNYGSSFSGSFSISRIYFDMERNFGVLTVGYFCGTRCGEGFTIFIKKVSDKWIIDEIVNTWIA
jgi:hypothetical protein